MICAFDILSIGQLLLATFSRNFSSSFRNVDGFFFFIILTSEASISDQFVDGNRATKDASTGTVTIQGAAFLKANGQDVGNIMVAP